GRDYNLDSTYASLLAQFDVSEQAFFSAYESKEILDITVNEFDWVQKAGVRGFPATVLKQGDQYTMLASGYTSIEQLNSTLQKVLTTA
ncbi:MAG: protein-disulfide isomerase-like protein with CxxC motif, partial [Cyclobacteriaceae bacterium]